MLTAEPLPRREFLRQAAFSLAAGGMACGRGAKAADSPLPRLRDVFQGRPRIGVAVEGRLPDGVPADELELIRGQFDILTPANCMKWDHLQPREGQFDFQQADAFVAFAEANRQKVAGHCFVWNRPETSTKWVFQDGDKPADAALVLQRMQTHIRTVMGRYRGRVHSWDVVNEALDDGKAFLRRTPWTETLGDEVVAKAFQCARRADPAATLVYNDYNIETPAKRAKLLRLLAQLRDANARADVVGIQGHWEIDRVPFEQIEETIVALHGAGVKVAVTELDIDMVPREKYFAGGSQREEVVKQDPYAEGCPADVLQRQADQYGRLFQIFARHSEKLDRVTLWGVTDRVSWLNAWPWKRVNHPLLFDRQAKPKPAFFAVLDAARGR